MFTVTIKKPMKSQEKNCLWLSLAPLQEVRRSSYSDSCAVRPDRRSFNVLRHAWTWHGHVAKELKKTGRILSTKEVGPVEKHPVFSTSVKILPALPPSRVQSRPGLLLHPLPKAARAKNVRASCDQRPWLRSWWQHFLSPVWRGKKVLVDDGWFVFLLACWPVLCILGIFGDFPNPWTQTFHILYQPTILWHCSDGSVASAGSQWWTATNATGNLINRAAKNVEIIAYPQLKGYKYMDKNLRNVHLINVYQGLWPLAFEKHTYGRCRSLFFRGIFDGVQY